MSWYRNERLLRNRFVETKSEESGNLSNVVSAGSQIAKAITDAEGKVSIITFALQATYACLLFIGQELGKGLTILIDKGWPHE